MDVTFELDVLPDLSQGRNLLLGLFSYPENGGKYSSETTMYFQRDARRFIPEDITFHNPSDILTKIL
jgi:hypothetical protein